MEAIEGARAACAEASQAGVHAYPSGSPFLFWEQYLGLRRCFLLAVCVLLVCTFLVCALLLLSPWTAALIVSMGVGTACCLQPALPERQITEQAPPAPARWWSWPW